MTAKFPDRQTERGRRDARSLRKFKEKAHSLEVKRIRRFPHKFTEPHTDVSDAVESTLFSEDRGGK
jgi:hypothetical protein